MSFFGMLARVGIISFLSVFSLSQAQSAEVEMKEEMYSDNKPKYKNIFTIDLSKDYHWDDEGFLKNSERAIIDLRVNQLFRHVSQFFQEIFFDSFLVSFSKKKSPCHPF